MKDIKEMTNKLLREVTFVSTKAIEALTLCRNRKERTNEIKKQMASVEEKAIDALATYEFMGFGVWSSVWDFFNHLLPPRKKQPLPFFFLVKAAREERGKKKSVELKEVGHERS